MVDKLKILWLKTGALHPLDTGGKLRTYNMLKEFNRRHKITYLALFDEKADATAKQQAYEYSESQIWVNWKETPKNSLKFYTEALLNIFSGIPYAIAKYRSAQMAQAIRENKDKNDIVICDFLTPAVNWMGDTARHSTPSLLFQHNVEAVIWRRHYENASTVLHRLYFYNQWKKMRNFEGRACGWFDGVVGVSEEDCNIMRKDYNLQNVLGSVPTGVDVDYFSQVQNEPEDGLIIFVGSMDWMANIDAVEYFVSKIYDRVKAKMSYAKLAIVGRKPPPRITELAEKDNSIYVTGTVPDVRPWLARAQTMIVPLRIGGGTRIKIYEAMAASVPVVSTSIGAEGLNVKNGENILIADSPEDFAEAVVKLLTDPELRNKIARSGKRLVEENYSWSKVVDVFEQYCLMAVKKKLNRRDK